MRKSVNCYAYVLHAIRTQVTAGLQRTVAMAPGVFHTHALATARTRQPCARLEKIRGQFTIAPAG